ncbi:MAG: bifunctional pyr operon transcriptional regulator/uracil phosphoribosyltransferase [Chloroflexi bacterium]|nr:bifunctional pyr operon transcriptional regulator/uracil phosphoribosyltransferase [Chloroflexota bacterium]
MDSFAGKELLPKVLMTSNQVKKALIRISHEIAEKNDDFDDLVILGIPTRGVHISKRIVGILSQFYSVNVKSEILDPKFYRDDLSFNDKKNLKFSKISENLENKIVILVDDVLFTGRTTRACLNAILDFGRPKSVQLAVLIDRGHRELPIRPDFIGKNIPTNRDQDVRVLLEEEDSVDEVVIINQESSAK